MTKPVRALVSKVDLGPGVVIEGYLLPSGSFRYGLEYISVLLGYAQNYFSRITKNSAKKLKALHSKGFTGYQIDVHVARLNGGASRAKTYSFDDFCIIIEHEASVERNPRAIALLTASFREVLHQRSCAAFGLPEKSTEQKQDDFANAFVQRLEWIAENQADLEAQWLPGDELHYPVCRDWEDIPNWDYVEVKKTKQKNQVTSLRF